MLSVELGNGEEQWTCSRIYASPHYSSRSNFWDYLVRLHTSIFGRWVLIGEFNEILLPSEQKGGVFSETKADRFSQALNGCDMIDLDFFGTKFTWQKMCRGNHFVSKRLDRAVADHRWRMRFEEATVEHLVKRNYDHNPLLLRCCQDTPNSQVRPFRFIAA